MIFCPASQLTGTSDLGSFGHVFIFFLLSFSVFWSVGLYLFIWKDVGRGRGIEICLKRLLGTVVELRLLLTVRALFSLCTPSPWRLPRAAEADVEMKTSQQRHGLVSRYTSGGTPQWVRYIAET